MAKVNALVHLFNAGEVSKAALGRIDKERVRLTAETQENIIPYVIGKGMMRPGTRYLGTSASNNRPRLIRFVKSVDVTALLELTDSLLRVWVSDALVTRASVTSTVTNGDFSSSTGWTLTVGSGATGNINSTVSGALYMAASARGSSVICTRSVSTSTAGTEHALRITVTRGPVSFRCGSTSGGDDYIEETDLDTGIHSLAFTPSGTYHVYFKTQREAAVIVDSIQVESAGVMTIAAPWTTAQLRAIQYDQSGDIVFLAHESWQQRKIERRGNSSWSLVLYKSDDGPFVTARTATVKLKPAATRGNTTLTSDAAFFRSEHVGALFRLTHDRFDANFALAGEAVYTDAWRVAGIRETSYANDRLFTYTTTGTWVGTVTMQRSLDGEEAGFRDFPIDDSTTTLNFTTNQTISHAGEVADNNVIGWHRLGFLAGDYTSGSINIAIEHAGHSGAGICRVTAFNSSTSVDVEVLQDFKSTGYTDDWQEGEWSDRRGWPSAATFFDGRLWWARDDKFWGSESDDYYAFNTDTEGDAGSIQRNVATGGSVNFVSWLLPLQRLIFGTDASEVSARSSSFDEPLTPTNLTLKDASSQGAASVSPAKIDGRGVFVQRSKTKLYEIVYSIDTNDYGSFNLNRFNEDISDPSLDDYTATGGIVEMAVQRQPETYLWCVRDDGVLALLIYEIKEDVMGWVRVPLGGATAAKRKAVSVAVLPATGEDRVYIARAFGSSYFIEKLALHSEARGQEDASGPVWKLADAHVFTAGPTTTVSGLSHLEGESVIAVGHTASADYVHFGTFTVSGGSISLGATGINVCAGLGYTGRYKSSKLSYGAQGGTALLQRKRVSQLGLLATDIHVNAVTYGPDFTTMRALPRMEMGEAVSTTAVSSVYDAPTFSFPGEWNTDSRVCLKITAGYPATFNGLVVGVETNEQ